MNDCKYVNETEIKLKELNGSSKPVEQITSLAADNITTNSPIKTIPKLDVCHSHDHYHGDCHTHSPQMHYDSVLSQKLLKEFDKDPILADVPPTSHTPKKKGRLYKVIKRYAPKLVNKYEKSGVAAAATSGCSSCATALKGGALSADEVAAAKSQEDHSINPIRELMEPRTSSWESNETFQSILSVVEPIAKILPVFGSFVTGKMLKDSWNELKTLRKDTIATNDDNKKLMVRKKIFLGTRVTFLGFAHATCLSSTIELAIAELTAVGAISAVNTPALVSIQLAGNVCSLGMACTSIGLQSYRYHVNSKIDKTQNAISKAKNIIAKKESYRAAKGVLISAGMLCCMIATMGTPLFLIPTIAYMGIFMVSNSDAQNKTKHIPQLAKTMADPSEVSHENNEKYFKSYCTRGVILNELKYTSSEFSETFEDFNNSKISRKIDEYNKRDPYLLRCAKIIPQVKLNKISKKYNIEELTPEKVVRMYELNRLLEPCIRNLILNS